MMKLPLTGKHAIGDRAFALVDDEDYPLLVKYPWNLSVEKKKNRRDFLTISTKLPVSQGRKSVRLHRMIMDYPEFEIDHKDNNRLNNQKSNLRLCTGENKSNGKNKQPQINSTSGYVGVNWREDRHLYYVTLVYKGEVYYIGSSKNKEEAAELRDLYALKYIGDFAYLNFPDKKEEYISKFDTIDLFEEKVFSSKQKGVSWDEARDLWASHIYYKGKSHFLGRFKTERDAARAFDVGVIKYGLNLDILNFPDEIEESIEWFNSLPTARFNSNGLNGIKKLEEGKWGSRIRVNKKDIWLGTFSDPVEAAKAYDQAVIKYGLSLRKLNFKDAA